MDFKQIEAFINVAKYKSFSKAASVIFLSQPTISCHISSLEKELNIQLFDRTSKEVNLTPSGESFLEYAINMINTRNSAIHHLSNLNINISGTLNLSASSTPCNFLVPKLIQEFSLMYPSVCFNIKEESSGQIIENILQSNCELGIVGRDYNDEKIKNYRLIEDELVIISTPSLHIPDEITMDELFKYKFIAREKNSATQKTFEEALKHAEINPLKLTICCEVNNLNTLLQFVKTGIGISVVSKQICTEYMNENFIKISRIKNLPLKRDLFLLVSSKRTLSPTGQAFLNLCKSHFRLQE